ncbi:PH domain-containing protein [Streptomyces sp. LP05-1]|uniref:PH domain-containing protein n=1 Tax=Streptomyces pyxinae TaxID=2970734 RepID=A0ABT2CB14_9ACTN|nr:PH domain-containing protein [Streptomyces sp. LP05-1]MCS0634603.1 PH domain-containing protein [Streptomyces sp. LP05-1]
MTSGRPDSSPDEPAEPAEPVYADRSYRSVPGMVGGGLMLALACWFAVDGLIRGSGRTPWLALAGLLLVVPLVVAFTFRPAVFANDDRLRVRNPFRDIVLPWARVADVRAGYSSEVLLRDGSKFQLWAVPVSLRQRKRAARLQARASQDDPHGRTPVTADVTDVQARTAQADRTITELRDLAERNADRPGAQGTVRVRWAYEILGPALAGGLLLVVLLALG